MIGLLYTDPLNVANDCNIIGRLNSIGLNFREVDMVVHGGELLEVVSQ